MRRGQRWLVLVVRVPAEPSRHRVAVWRELRRAGAVPLGQGRWAVPDVPAVGDRIARATELAPARRRRGRGAASRRTLPGRRGPAGAAVHPGPAGDWAEFIADCGKFSAEIDAEIGKARFTLAELEEEEQSLDRLRCWHRVLATRDVSGAPGAAEAGQQLRHCAERLAGYTDLVFQAIHQV